VRAFSGDWLDRLARHSVGDRKTQVHKQDSTRDDEERYSRGTAVKLAATGLASVSLGLWRAGPSLAQDEGECFKDCNTRLDTFELNFERACYEKFGESRKWAYQTPVWKQILLLMTFPGTMVQQTLAASCALTGTAVVQQAREGCLPECQRRCGKRASQSRAFSDEVCEAPPPPPQRIPKPPPAPNLAEDPCWPLQPGRRSVLRSIHGRSGHRPVHPLCVRDSRCRL
jgi:hypothetical protein